MLHNNDVAERVRYKERSCSGKRRRDGQKDLEIKGNSIDDAQGPEDMGLPCRPSFAAIQLCSQLGYR